MKTLLLNIIIVLPMSIMSQTGLFVDGANINVQQNTLMFVEGDIEIMLAGAIEDSGEIELTRHWVNNSGNFGLINNAPGTVRLTGGNQYLTGADSTVFYNLELRGGGVKEAFQNQTITNVLDLGSQELQVHKNIVHVTNTHPTNSLVWTSGFISGDSIGGYFARSTRFATMYPFPVGNNNITNTSSLYRAVSLTPANSDSNVYGVRLAFEDASLDQTGTSFTGAFGPYNRSQREDFIVQVNPSFYHHVVRMQGTTPAYASIYFYENDHIDQDRRLDGLANWDRNEIEWKFETKANLDADLTAYPQGFGNPEHAMRWIMDNDRDDPFALTVMEGIQVFVPQIFSPNGDGFNDVLFVRGRKISEVTFVIYNRWGEKVFETKDKDIGWNGLHRGKDAQASVYVYYVDAIVEDVGRVTQKGNITLVR